MAQHTSPTADVKQKGGGDRPRTAGRAPQSTSSEQKRKRGRRARFAAWALIIAMAGGGASLAAFALTEVDAPPTANPMRAADESGETYAGPRIGLPQAALALLGIGGSDGDETDTSEGANNDIATYDKAIAALLLDASPPRAELDPISNAISATYAGRSDDVRAAMDGIESPHAHQLIDWYRLRGGHGGTTPAMIEAFIAENPDWPSDPLLDRIEATVLHGDIPAADVIERFEANPPRTAEGKAALAIALLEQGRADEATTLAREVWFDRGLAKRTEDAVLRELGPVLTPADHKRRVDVILLYDSRWRSTRAARVRRAQRIARLLDDAERKKIDARIKVYKRQRGSTKALASLGDDRLEDVGILHQHIQQLRRDKKHREAWAHLLTAPTETVAAISPDDWWIERQVNAYKALYEGEPQIAYDLVKEVGDVSVNPRNEASFMAGWIALRFLDDADAAEVHFRSMTETADGPRTRSTSAYWLARTLEAKGDKRQARRWYVKASEPFNTFYGLISRQILDPKNTDLTLPLREVISAADITRFHSNKAVRAMIAASKAGLSSVTRRLINDLRRGTDDPKQLALLAHLVTQLGDTQMGVRIGKTGLFYGWKLAHWAYPVHAMPDYEPLREPIEEAILYGIARQESEFNTLIQSGAGAQGILQVMQITAKDVCRTYKIKCRLKELKSDPSYNAQLASAYISDRHDQFSGNYTMTFAGYNAGPGRVRYWLRNIGDPRTDYDTIDWVEMVHIKETREYMKKVLANVQVYRARLAGEKGALRIRDDLQRGRSGG